MLRWVYSPDGVTIGGTAPKLPKRLARRMTADPTAADALAPFGFHLVDTSDPEPSGIGWVETIDNDAPGVFVRRWTFDQTQADREQAEIDARQAQQAAKQAAAAERQAIRDADAALAAFLDLDPPTAAETVQQVRRLTRAVRYLARNL